MGQNPQPTPEELDFVYQLLLRGLSNAELQDELQETEFPLRKDTRYFRQRRREFDAAKRVLGDSRPAQMDPLVIQARRKHFEDLLDVAKAWNKAMIWNVGDTVIVNECKVPTNFTKENRAVGRQSKGPLVWGIGRHGDVEVWLGIERSENMFARLLDHLPADVVEAYSSLKSNLAQAIKSDSGRSDTDIVNSVFSLSTQLDDIIATRIFDGSCRICSKLMAAELPAGADDDKPRARS